LKYSIEYFDGDSVDLEFSEGRHTYRVGGEYVPSVTTILGVINKPALMPWAAKEGARWFMDNTSMVPDQEDKDAHPVFADGVTLDDMYNGIRGAFRATSKEARDIGTMVHEWCEQAINWKLGNGDEPTMPTDERAVSAIDGFRDWIAQNNIEWVSSEERIYNRQYNYAGTVDAVAYVNDEFCVIDFKTSTGIWDEYFLQVAAYAEAVAHVHGDAIESAWILRFDKKTGEFEAGKSEDINADFRAFLGAQQLHGRLRQLKNKR
jgi:hypothetical protein